MEENLDDHGCSKIQNLVDEENWICSSYPFRHETTLHFAQCKTKLFGNWTLQHIKLSFFRIVKGFVGIYWIKTFKWFNYFPEFQYWEIEPARQMIDQEDSIYLAKIVFDDNNQERKSRSYLVQTCCGSLILFLSQLFVILIIFGCFRRIRLSKICDESTVWVGILCSADAYILPSPRLWIT